MVRLVVKNKHQRDVWDNEIGLQAQDLFIILTLVVNTIERVYVITKRKRRILHIGLVW